MFHMTDFFKKAEAFFLLALIFFLPLLEAPKNLFWLLFVVFWLINHRHTWVEQKWDHWDSLFLLWISSGYIVAIFSGLKGGEYAGAHDLLRYAIFGWFLKRSNYTESFIEKTLWMTLVSTLITLLFGFYELWITHKITALQLHSVGHVNHSAIYLLLVFGVGYSILLSYFSQLTLSTQIFSFVSLLTLVFGLLVSSSRAALGIFVIIFFALTAFFIFLASKKQQIEVLNLKKISLLILPILLVFSFFVFSPKTEIYNKIKGTASINKVLNGRELVWPTAWVTFRAFPVFGIGMDNYSQIKKEQVIQWAETNHVDFDPKTYLNAGHAHNLYLNTLVERGLFGLTVLLLVLFSWFGALIKDFLKIKRSRTLTQPVLAWTLWGTSLSSFIVTIGVGIGNTTIHHEHGILTMLFLGLWLFYRRHYVKQY